MVLVCFAVFCFVLFDLLSVLPRFWSLVCDTDAINCFVLSFVRRASGGVDGEGGGVALLYVFSIALGECGKKKTEDRMGWRRVACQ